MSYRTSAKGQLPSSTKIDDSFLVASSDDEDYDETGLSNKTAARTAIINDSDSKGEDSVSLHSSGDESPDSEDEDLQFMNRSHKVSIIENSSESESDEDEEITRRKNILSNKLKRRSIYDNPVSVDSPTSSSTPMNRRHLRKQARVLYSDSESEKENFSGNQTKYKSKEIDNRTGDTTHSKKINNVLPDSNKHNQEENENFENVQMISDDSINYENSKSTTNSDVNMSETESFTTNKNSVSKKIIPVNSYDLSELKNLEQPFKNVTKTSGNNFISPKIKPVMKEKTSASNLIDLTMNESMHEFLTEEKKVLSKEPKINESDVIVCSSTSTSETELDNEIVTIAKKEIGVGNIDPIEAQKKELLLLKIDHNQMKLDKLRKFTTTVDVSQLPDKGAKVQKSIEEIEMLIVNLKKKLADYSRKTNTPVKLNSIKKVERPDTIPLIVKSPLTEDKIDIKKKLQYSNVQIESNINNDPDFNQFNDFDVREIPNVPQTSFKTDDLGKRALETLNKQQSLTEKRLKQLHGSLTSRPTEDQRENDPSGLKVSLMDHQKYALAWMKWRETQKPKGGILADDMGLGKTLSMISLILATVNEKRQYSDSSDNSSSDDEWISRKKHKRYYGGTLVVCPASLIKQWEAEVKNRCKRGLLSVLVFHGNNRTVDDRKLSRYNIVITTYQIIVREADAESSMYRMEWNRIILDEAHYIRNHKSKACIAVSGLTSKHKWALTGTPIQNKEMDLYAILKFLNCSPFDDLQVWKRWVDNKNDAGKQRLVTIMKGLMLRRTKQELHAKGSFNSLPDKSIELIEIEMDRDENLAYQKILLFSQNLFAQFLAQRAEKQHVRELYGGKFDKPSYSSYGSKTQFTKAQKVLLDHHSGNIEAHEILVLLLRLRQMCCHPALIHAMLDQQDAEINGIDEHIDSNNELLNKLQNMSVCLSDEEVEDYVANYKIDDRVTANLLTKKNPVFDDERRSSKTRAIIQQIQQVLEKGDKLIVVSQWTSFLEIIAKNLEDIEDAKYAMFTGKVAVKNRQAIVDKFNNPNEDTNILLLSLTAGGVGLNLVGANHLLLVDIHWNPQLESQAQDRIYRFGQKKNVQIYKFICKDTIEERVKNLQDKKLAIADHILTGTRSVSSKLTIDDLKLLFS